MQVHDASIPTRIARGAALTTAAIAPVALGASALFAGGPGVAGSALGIAIVAAFFTISAVVLGRVDAHLLLPAALLVYAVKIVALGVTLRLVGGVAAFDHAALGWSAFAALVGWLGTEVVLFGRAKILYVEPGTGG